MKQKNEFFVPENEYEKGDTESEHNLGMRSKNDPAVHLKFNPDALSNADNITSEGDNLQDLSPDEILMRREEGTLEEESVDDDISYVDPLSRKRGVGSTVKQVWRKFVGGNVANKQEKIDNTMKINETTRAEIDRLEKEFKAMPADGNGTDRLNTLLKIHEMKKILMPNSDASKSLQPLILRNNAARDERIEKENQIKTMKEGDPKYREIKNRIAELNNMLAPHGEPVKANKAEENPKEMGLHF